MTDTDVETFMSSLDDAQDARAERGLQSKRFRTTGFDATLHIEDIVTLVYAARMVHECATSEEERDEIFDSVRTIEQELGILYAFDQTYDVERPFGNGDGS